MEELPIHEEEEERDQRQDEENKKPIELPDQSESGAGSAVGAGAELFKRQKRTKRRIWPWIAIGLIGAGFLINYFAKPFRRAEKPKTELRELRELRSEIDVPKQITEEAEKEAQEKYLKQLKTFKYTIQPGDNLYTKVKQLGIKKESKVKTFIDDLIEEQSKYSSDLDFLEGIALDNMAVIDGKLVYGVSDGIKGDEIWAGDEFIISEELAENYNISEKSLAYAGFKPAQGYDLSRKSDFEGEGASIPKQDIFSKYVSTRTRMLDKVLTDEKLESYKKDFGAAAARITAAYNLGVRPSQIAKQSSEAVLQSTADVYETLAWARKRGAKLKGRFNYKIAARSNDLDIVYGTGTYEQIKQRFTEQTGMSISRSTIYRLRKNKELVNC